MKKLSCITMIIVLSLTLGAHPARSRLKPVSPVARPTKRFIPTKPEFKHLRATPLPVRSGQVDRREMVLRASLAGRDVISYLDTNQKRTIQSVIQLLRGKNTPAAQRQWSRLIDSFKNGSTPIDINDLIQYVLRQSYMETNRDLQFYAAKIRYMNEQKQAIRNYLQSLREMQDGVSSRAVLEDIRNAIDAAEEKLRSIGDDAQLATIDLQGALEKKQQVIQILSNVSKSLHDTATAVIRNIK